MRTNSKKYSFSFTTCSLRPQDSIKIAEAYVKNRDWDVVRHLVVGENLLQQRTTRSLERLYQELSSRLKCLTQDEIIYFVNAPDPRKRLILWIAVCRRYDFIHEFAVEIIRENCFKLDFQLDDLDFVAFFTSKLSLHAELNSISATTKGKARQVIFRMLREAGLMDRNNNIAQDSVSIYAFDRTVQQPNTTVQILMKSDTKQLSGIYQEASI